MYTVEEKPFDFYQMATWLREAFLQAVEIKEADDIKWTGPDTFPTTSVISLPPGKSLSSDSLQYHKEQGRDTLDVLIQIALQLGIEQGVRITRNSAEYQTLKLIEQIYIKGKKIP